MIDGDWNKPVRRNLYYINEEKDILIYITHIYSYVPLEKHLLTMDEPEDQVKELLQKNKSVEGLGFYEIYMSYRNTLASMKVFYVGDKENRFVNDEDALTALEAYTNILE